MSETPLSLQPRPFGGTGRPDAWWVQPLAVLLGLSAFIAYSTWAAFQGEHDHHGPYLSPFYSPGVGTLVLTLNVLLLGAARWGVIRSGT